MLGRYFRSTATGKIMMANWRHFLDTHIVYIIYFSLLAGAIIFISFSPNPPPQPPPKEVVILSPEEHRRLVNDIVSAIRDSGL
jgi:hypothetical protein